ncbi:nuclear transport factor 2 family protein [Dyella psychrodurans]|nr:nuclear transport factor 2 family protein [Dyella psychrodurans]
MNKFSRIASVGMLLLLPSLSTMACGTSNDPAQVVQAQVDAYNAHDIDAFAACYAENVTITNLSGEHKVIKGVQALKSAYAFLAKVPKEFHVEIVQRVVTGPTVVDKERVVGLPAGKGRPDAMAVYEVRNGKILNVWFPPEG